MINHIVALTFLVALTACSSFNSSSTDSSSDLVNPALLQEAQPLYEACLKDYQLTMSDEAAKQFCTEKVKEKAVKTWL